MEMLFDVNVEELFTIIGQLYVEKRKATAGCIERDARIAELNSRIGEGEASRNEDEQ